LINNNTNTINNLNPNLDFQDKSAATNISLPTSHFTTSPIKQIQTKIPPAALKVEAIAKAQETTITNYTSQAFISNTIIANTNEIGNANSTSVNINNFSGNMPHQRSFSGKFNIVSGFNSATHSSSNVNSVAIPSNTLSSSNLNFICKDSAHSEAAAKPKNEEIISYDTESNDSSPRINLQINNINNSALTLQKNLNSNANLSLSNSNFSVAYSASQGKANSEEKSGVSPACNNISNVNNVNSALSGQSKSLKISFPIAGGIDEKGSYRMFYI